MHSLEEARGPNVAMTGGETMRRLTVTLACAVALIAAPNPARSQIGDQLASLAQDNGELYVQPLFEGLGQALGTGFLRTPSVHGKLGFDVSIRLMGALVSDEKKTFMPVIPTTIDVNVAGNTRTFTNPYTGPTSSPTAMGKGSGATFTPTGPFLDSLNAHGLTPSNYNLSLPDGFNIPAVPFALAEVGVGLGLGTEVRLRVIPTITPSEDVGEIGAFGVGVVHSLNQWIVGPMPVDLAVFGGYQSFKVGDYLTASTTALGASVGKGLGPLSAYLIGQYSKPSVDLEYTVSNASGNPGLPADGTVISFSPDVSAGTKVGVGAQFSLIIIQFAAEYTRGDYNTVTARASFGLR